MSVSDENEEKRRA